MKKKRFSLILSIIIAAILVVIDQITKRVVYNGIRLTGPVPLIDGVLEFSYLENRGAAWGMMAGARVIFVIIALGITVVIGWLLYKMPEESRYIPLRITGILLASGAIGNMIDRVINNFVIDFIYFKVINFPVFNVADIYVTIAAICMVILIVFVYKDADFDFLKKDKNEEYSNR